MEGTRNAAAEIARSTTCSGASFAMPNVTGSKQMAKKTVRTTGEWKMNKSTGRMVRGSIPQFLGTPGSSYANPPMAGRADSVTPLTYTNSSRRKMQSPMSVPGQAQVRWQIELEDVRQKQKELADHQHLYTGRRVESGKQRAAELQKFEVD